MEADQSNPYRQAPSPQMAKHLKAWQQKDFSDQ
jgi:hypothetical protein